MTSKSLFFKMMRQDIRRKLWAIGLCFLVFFMALPVSTSMEFTRLSRLYAGWLNGTQYLDPGIVPEIELLRRTQALATDTLGMQNFFAAAFTMILAVVFAVTGFLFLHSKKQIDFYNSIPVKREILFAVRYLDDILIFTVPYLINMLFTVMIFAANGFSFSLALTAGMETLAVHLAGFLLMYGVMAAAVLLTGNFFISILGGIVLFFYIPAITLLVQFLCDQFFVTQNGNMTNFYTFMEHGSPCIYYFGRLIGNGSALELQQYSTMMPNVLYSILISMVIAGIDLLLYCFRPSEAAGKAMAFPITKTPIKMLIVIPASILGGLFFWSMYYSFTWAVFGFLFALLLSHALIEIIYHFEFGKLKEDPLHIVICGVIALAIIGIFRYDLFGYDSYLPKEEEYKSAAICAYELDDWTDYGLPYLSDAEYGNYGWQYMNRCNYVFENMKISDYDVVKKIAETGIENAKTRKEKRLYHAWDAEEVDYQEPETMLDLKYNLNNGKAIYRRYNVSLSWLEETMEELYRGEEYKKGTYPVLSYAADNLTGIYESRGEKIRKVNTEAVTIEELLTAYQKELTALSIEERRSTIPVTSLRFLTIAETEYIDRITASRTENRIRSFRIEDMSQVNFFPVYPSFTKTIELLKACGEWAEQDLDVANIARIELRSTNEDEPFDDKEIEWDYPATAQTMDIQRMVIENDGSVEAVEKIMEVLNSSYYQDMARLNGLYDEEYGLLVYIYEKSESDVILNDENAFIVKLLDINKTPSFVKAELPDLA